MTEATTIDSKTTLVLIRAANSGVWEDKTTDIESLGVDDQRIHVKFVGSNKTYEYHPNRVRILNDPVAIPVPEGARLLVRGFPWRQRAASDLTICEFGSSPDAWLRIYYRAEQGMKHKSYVASDVQIIPDASRGRLAGEVMTYWRKIVESRKLDEAHNHRQDPIVASYRLLEHVDPGSALAKYLNGEAPSQYDAKQPLVFPFACNLSQREAVRKAVSNSMSVIEGPPGTGKTETILNLIANIVTSDLGSVAVVSFSNKAVENVGEKLAERGFGGLVAHLGNEDHVREFLARHAEEGPLTFESDGCDLAEPESPTELADVSRRLTRLLESERVLAELRGQIDVYVTEQRHFERHLNADILPELSDLPLLRGSAARIIELLAENHVHGAPDRPGFLRRIQRYFRYGRLGSLDPSDSQTVLALESAFYHRRLAELKRQLADAERRLAADDVTELTNSQQEISARALRVAIARRRGEYHTLLPGGRLPRDTSGFARFCNTYPVILSTCHSLRKCLPVGYLLDYLVIDEASQLDLLAASLAMASCRNLVVVGDQHQLPHIPGYIPDHLIAPAPAYDCQRQSVLTSLLELYGESLPRTLLREHYRSHPAIIGFCNSAFYDDELISYTTSDGRAEPAMWVHKTVAGNHMRKHHDGGRSNQREIDVIREEVLDETPVLIEARDIAVVAPYRRQVQKATASLGESVGDVDTVHKLQGRQKRMVVLTTVLSETWLGSKDLEFVDDPRLVNVAVSRAIDHFVLVTNNQGLSQSRHVRDLIGYIEYQYPDRQPATSRIVSVFDLLYREYDGALQSLARRLHKDQGSPAEHIIEVVLDEILDEPEHKHLRATSQMYLRNLVSTPETLNEEQRIFIRRASSIDFVVYNHHSRQPVLAIEVDGFAFHENRPDQLRRDAIKDSILAAIGVPLLRLATTGSGEERKIRQALANAESLLQDSR